MKENEVVSSFEPIEDETEKFDVTDDFVEIETPDYAATYREIKHIIYDGFIPVKLDFVGSNVLMKSIYETEFKYIDLITNNPLEKLPLYFLYSIVCINGQEILADRKRYQQEIQEIFRSFPVKVLDAISTTINQVQTYHSSSYENLEGFLYERECRTSWEIYKAGALNGMFPHLKTLGYNSAQETWILFNQREDDRIREELEFGHSKFIVSGFVGGKEIKKISKQEQMRWNDELRRRQDVRLKNKFDQIRLSAPVNTSAELVAELKRQIKGEKDKHDEIIEMHENLVREQSKKRRDELQYLRMKADEKRDIPEGLSGGSRAVTKEEMEKNIKETSQRKVNPLLHQYEQLDRYASKIELTSGLASKKKTEMPAVPTSSEGPKVSIFDKEVQEQLQKLSKIK